MNGKNRNMKFLVSYSLLVLDGVNYAAQIASVLKVLLHALGRNQSTCVLQNMFATQRSLVFKVGF